MVLGLDIGFRLQASQTPASVPNTTYAVAPTPNRTNHHHHHHHHHTHQPPPPPPQARALIESSTACKCPSVTYQLAGSKKVQQDLARPGVVERFVGQEQGAALRQLFAGACLVGV
jgi:hypothetical protein